MSVGTSTGVGNATGVLAGVRGTANAAQQEGLLTEEQVDAVFDGAVNNLKGLTQEAYSSSEAIVGTASCCDAVLQRLRDAAAPN
jgi:hypothetical protein